MIDEDRGALGGVRIAPRGEGDARDDLDGQYEDWFAALRPLAAAGVRPAGRGPRFRETRLQPLYAVEPASGSASSIAASAGAKAVASSRTANCWLRARIARRGISSGARRGMTYRAGDHLAVVPRNDESWSPRSRGGSAIRPTTSSACAARKGRRAQLPLDEPISVGRLLSDYLELQQPATRKQIQTMAEHTRCPVTQPKLEALSGESEESAALYRAEVLARRKSVFDLLEEFPACELPLSAYLEMAPLLQPRYYSISSSPKLDPHRCSGVTVGVVEGRRVPGRGTFRGVCSIILRRASPTRRSRPPCARRRPASACRTIRRFR